MSSPEQAALNAFRDDINEKWGQSPQLSNNDPSDPGSFGRDTYLVDTNLRVKRLAADVAAVLAQVGPQPSQTDGKGDSYGLMTFVPVIDKGVADLAAKVDALAAKVDALGAALDAKK